MKNETGFLFDIHIDQKDMVDFDLDLDFNDMAIYALFRKTKDWHGSPKITINKDEYTMFTKTYIIKQLPKLGIKSKSAIAQRLGNLVSAGILKPYQNNQTEGVSYYKYGDVHNKMEARNFEKQVHLDGSEIEDPYRSDGKPLTVKQTSPYRENGNNNNTLIIDNNKKDKSEEQKKITRTPKVKKQPSQADPNAKAESYWQNELTNNPEAVAKLRAWCADQSKEKIGQFLSVFNHSYSEKQLHSYCEHYAQILDIPIYKTHFSQLGEIFSCDLVQHILSKAKYEFEKKGSINIPLPKKEQVKRILPADDLFKF